MFSFFSIMQSWNKETHMNKWSIGCNYTLKAFKHPKTHSLLPNSEVHQRLLWCFVRNSQGTGRQVFHLLQFRGGPRRGAGKERALIDLIQALRARISQLIQSSAARIHLWTDAWKQPAEWACFCGGLVEQPEIKVLLGELRLRVRVT